MEELDASYKKNIFHEVLGNEFGDLFQNVYYSDIYTRDQKMQELYDKSKESTLSDSSKELIENCMIAYNFATFKSGIPNPLLDYYEKKRPNIEKYTSGVRLYREIDNLDLIFHRLGFEFDLRYISSLCSTLLVSYGYDSNKEEFKNIDLYLPILASRFIRKIPMKDYKNMWYCAILLKTVSDMAYISPKMLEENKDLQTRRETMTKFIIGIYYSSKKKKIDK